jgi:hypothetical protein
MALFEVRSLSGFLTGMLTGCWIGGLVACAATLLLMGKRVRQLETINRLLRSKLRLLERPHRMGTGGPALVMPRPGTLRSEQAHRSRAVQGR